MFSAKQEVKNSGKTMIVSYSDYQVQLKNDYQKELELIQGIENQEFILHYQPKVYADSGRFYGVEGLIRWQVTGEDRLRYPDEFIPLSEKTGHILELTKQLVEMSVKQIKCWLTKGYEVPISVNVSAEHFQEDELVALIEELLKNIKFHLFTRVRNYGNGLNGRRNGIKKYSMAFASTRRPFKCG